MATTRNFADLIRVERREVEAEFHGSYEAAEWLAHCAETATDPEDDGVHDEIVCDWLDGSGVDYPANGVIVGGEVGQRCGRIYVTVVFECYSVRPNRLRR